MKKISDVPILGSEERNEAMKYFHDSEVIKFVVDYNRRYLHWEEVKNRKKKIPIKPLYLWYLMKFFRTIESPLIVNFGPYSFSYTILEDFQEKLHILDKGAAGNLSSTIDAISDTRDKYILNSLMEEAIASSQIEGATPSRRVAKEMLRQKRKPTNKDEKMILNNYNTMRYVLEIKNEEMTPELLLKIQKMMTEDTLENPDDEGVYRDNDDIRVFDNDGEVLHIPPKKEEISALINELCNFANEDSKTFIHPVIKGIFLHYLLNYIHPFNDGNGRTGRSLFYWYVLKNDYWLFEYMSVSRLIYKKRRQYKLAYQYSESDFFWDKEKEIGDLTYFIKFNLTAIIESLHEIQNYLDKKQKEQYQALKGIKESDKLNIRQRDIMKQFIKYPQKTLTIKEVMNTQGVSYATARSDLFNLEEIGHLQKQKLGKEFVFILMHNDV
ncbi:Fic family protein [Methanolobus bombayensis]|uniref:Fic family protein n=1 Tax=Methanolobus bombayensis TaxID=38023 RepID=UPI001AE75088|nr:Fic family protein [Methanolobus bombayensis]MBP1910116.1 Fic family protein [Methanolobus bombayensis]